MSNLSTVLFVLATLLLASGAVTGYLAKIIDDNYSNIKDMQELLSEKDRLLSFRQYIEVEPLPLMVLKEIYRLQENSGGVKVMFARSGDINGRNLIREIFQLNASDTIDEKTIDNFERLILKIPVTYLRPLGTTRMDSPYELSVTPEGIAYLKTKM